jgi:hypothetical protein
VPTKQLINRRLTALWALSEAGLGGLLHAFKLPFSGIFVGGFALISIGMISWHNQFKALPLIRAWIIVSAVKFGLSPHSPFTAYLAVSFQAFFSLLCFRLIPSFRLASLVTGAVCTMESALQRILVLTILFGVGLWAAIDTYVERLLFKFGLASDYSGTQWVVGAYLLAHLIMGLLIGWWAGSLPSVLKRMNAAELASLREARSTQQVAFSQNQSGHKKSKSWFRKLRVPVMLLLVGGLLWYLQVPLYYFVLRGAVLWLAWVLLFEELVQSLLHRLVGRLSADYQQEVHTVREDLPGLRSSARLAWRLSSDKKGWGRLRQFSTLFFALGLELDQFEGHF